MEPPGRLEIIKFLFVGTQVTILVYWGFIRVLYIRPRLFTCNKTTIDLAMLLGFVILLVFKTFMLFNVKNILLDFH